MGRVFANRIKKAAQLVGQDGLLIIIVDASDNAVTAARKTDSRCFVPDLRRLDVPANCCLVYSCRTHRRDLIVGSDALPQVQLDGFDSRASTAFVRTYIPEADDTLCAAVHERSGGVSTFPSVSSELPAYPSVRLRRGNGTSQEAFRYFVERADGCRNKKQQPEGTWLLWQNPVFVGGKYLPPERIKDGKQNWLIVVINCPAPNLLTLYRCRWGIETLFQALKGRGFDLEGCCILG
jgi:hypothetical protein